MVFRRDNKVDQFQRQMDALRHQIGGEEEAAQADLNQEVPDIADERFPDEQFDDRGPDAGGYSFGSYPAAAQAPDEIEEDNALSVPEMPGVDSQISVVAQGALWKGEVEADGSVHVFGRVEGTLTAKEDIWVAEGADVEATLTARRVIVAGRVSGHVKANSRFEALPQGVIEADVTAPSFVVHEGATINGKLSMQQQEVTSGRQERSGSTTVVPRRNRG